MSYDGRLLSGVTVLMAVVEAGSMTRAAEALGLTSSGVGRAVARLEARVGVRLLERTTRTLTLTDEGRRFHEEVGPHLDGIEQAVVHAAGSAGTVQGRLRVNVDPFFSRVVLSGQVATFLERHPEVRVEMIMRDAAGDLVADGFDLALRFGEPPHGTLIGRKLAETRILTVASPGFVERYGRPGHPSEVARLPCIEFYDAANARPFEWEFRNEHEVLALKVASRLMVSDVGAMLNACEAGAGIAQIMELGSKHLIEEGRLIDLFPDWSGERFPLYALYPSRQHRAAKIRAFIEFAVGLLDDQT
ncbi:LysR family transcriptional regulator [Rhizosaccharibacter radicis]|uniref:LysR family transcriptional regulator n=1 Tax=Rhizosaccharibacter radicis TaxID=2782605 RepID=A0ABT1W0Z4_9PROT|nr:LysR family transcriptional regulator [Acetobacteraceae bacterium KSS12]